MKPQVSQGARLSKAKRNHQHLDDEWIPHAEFDAILQRLNRISDEEMLTWSGYAFRFSAPEFARKGERLKGIGAKMFGGRWNPKGLAACYGSATPQLAMDEAYGVATRGYGFKQDDLSPKVIFAFQMSDLQVLDFTDGRLRQRLRISIKTMLTCRWRISRISQREAVTQAMGRAAFLSGCQGLLVPSQYSSSEANLVVFPEAKGVTNRLRIVDAEKLDLLN